MIGRNAVEYTHSMDNQFNTQDQLNIELFLASIVLHNNS